MKKKKKKVIIIGAGPAGLTAGVELLRKSKDYDVTILEASNEIGGIAKTINYKGNRMDMGGHRFFTKSEQVSTFWKEFMPIQGKGASDDILLNKNKDLPLDGPNPETDDQVMLKRERVSRIYYLKKFFDYPITIKLQTFKNMGLVRTITAGFSYLKSLFKKKEETSLENFYINRFGKKLYAMFFEKYTEKLWGRHPSVISADWGSQRVKGLSLKVVIKNMFNSLFHIHNENVETSLIEEFLYPKYGPGQLWETVAQEIIKLNGKILMQHQVVKINKKNKQIISVTCNVNGHQKEIKGDLFISSMPLKDLITGMDNVPKNIRHIATNLPYRSFVTIGLLVKKLEIKNTTNKKTINDIIPDCWIYVQEPNVKLGRIQIFNNWSPYLLKDPRNSVWLGLEYFCDEFDDFWNMDDTKCINFAIDELETIGFIKKNSVIDSHLERVSKAYPAYFDTYNEIDTLITYLNTFDNLYCIGRNGQHHYNNMDHSMMTSFVTVDNIINDIKDHDNIWKVNTDKIYNEEKINK